jgi:hypothetical protein
MRQHSIEIGIPEHDDDVFYEQFYGVTLDQTEKVNIDSNKSTDELEIYITSFDGLLYAKYQIKTLRKFMGGADFKLIFCDTNSHIHPEVSKLTKELCIKENIGYVKLPHNKFQDMESFSMKLGVDLNWIWRNCIQIREPKYFGFIEQDCFLIDDIWAYLKTYLDKKGMYGLAWPQTREPIESEYWVVHIMNNFFKFDFVKDRELDFRPAGFIGLDTGGCNYFHLFKYYNRLDYIQDEFQLTEIVGHEWEDVFREFSLHHRSKWLHIKNSTKPFTNHKNEREYKEIYMTGVLDGILLSK